MAKKNDRKFTKVKPGGGGTWWKPGEGETIEGTLVKSGEGKYSPFVVLRSEDGIEMKVNVHEALTPLLELGGRYVRLTYLGQPEKAHEYEIEVAELINAK